MSDTTFDIDVIAAADLDVISLSDGQPVYARGDDGDYAYMVRRGTVEIRCAGHAIEIISPGELFGGLTLLDNQPRICSAVAIGDVEVIAISRSMFEALVRDDPDFAHTMMKLVVRRLRATFALLEQPHTDPQAEPALTARATV